MANDHERPYRLAVLIDAENASPRIVSRLFEEIAAIGDASVRRIYGDFSGTHLRGWAEVLATYAIIPQQNFANTAGKNASDIALVIDAMDLLHTGRFDAFCLVSSDSDFTRLAARIREQGLDVYGFGDRKAPDSVQKACKRFVFLEPPAPVVVQDVPVTAKKASPASQPRPHSAAIVDIQTALSQLDPPTGWHHLGAVGSHLSKSIPSFNLKRYGCSKLVTLVEKTGAFEIRRDDLSVYIRTKGG